MRLTELEPQFIRLTDQIGEHGGRIHEAVSTLPEADGIHFLCPKCFQENKGNIGTHGVTCWFEGHVPDDIDPGPGRWKPKGTGFKDLSFVPSNHSRSVRLLQGCKAHFNVTKGEVK